jgi:quercetin dioxygenase-like cupin family protein
MYEGGLALALLKFGRDATIDEHAGTSHADVFCLEGQGFVSLGMESSPIASGQRVVWPPGVEHRLWTEDTEMVTLMVERDST